MSRSHLIPSVLVVLVLPLQFAAAQPMRSTPFISPTLVSAESRAIGVYGRDLDQYVAECSDPFDANRLPADRLKTCLTTLATLRTTFDGVLKEAGNVVAKLKAAGKWTVQLDSEFSQHAAARGVPAATMTAVARGAGVRVAYESTIARLASTKGAFDTEMREIEGRLAMPKAPGGPAHDDELVLAAVKRLVKIIFDDLRYMTCGIIGDTCTYTR